MRNLSLLFLSLGNLRSSPFLAGQDRVSVAKSKISYSVAPFSYNVHDLHVRKSSLTNFLSPAIVMDIPVKNRLEHVKSDKLVVLCSKITETNVQNKNGGAILIDNEDAIVKLRYVYFSDNRAKMGGAVYCPSAKALICQRCIFFRCQAEKYNCIYSNTSETLDLDTCLIDLDDASVGPDSIGLTGPYHHITYVNTTKIRSTGYGSSFGFRSCDAIKFRFNILEHQAGKSCIWFWDTPSTNVLISEIIIKSFETLSDQDREAAIYSNNDVVIHRSIFKQISCPLWYGRSNNKLRLFNCHMSAVDGTSSVINSGSTADNQKTATWPDEFINGQCVVDEIPVRTESPSASRSAPPSPTRSRSPSATATRSPSESRSPTATKILYTPPATETRSPSLSATPARTAYPERTPTPSQSPTVPYPYGVYVGMSACVSFVLSIILFFVIFFLREISHKSSEDTVGLLDDYVNSDKGQRSASSSTDPLNLNSSSSEEMNINYDI